MAVPLVFLTGFEPFLDVERNPSGELARSLAQAPPEGVQVAGAVLPVSFTHTPPAFEAALAGVRSRGPVALLGLGVQRSAYFRLERRARARLDSQKPDNEGTFASELEPVGERDLETALDLERLREALLEGGAGDARVSQDAGGYLCERTYYLLLEAAEELGVPALFLHIPPVEAVALEQQARVLGSLVRELVSQASAQ